MNELRLYEKKVLLALKELAGKASIDAVTEKSGLAHASVMRAVLSLSERGMIRLYEHKRTIATLNEEGWSYVEEGLPERRLLKAIIELGGGASIEEASKKAGLSGELASIALGWLCRKGWVNIEGGKCISKVDKDPPVGSDEELMKLLAEKRKVSIEDLSREQSIALGVLKRRKLVNLDEKVQRFLELTDIGWKAVEKGLEIVEEVTQLTPELIITGKWRGMQLAKFDVKAPTPPVYPGKAHPLQQIIKRAREIFLEMGFTEIRGPLVETAFWNFDALFQPQDHPAREMMDTFYLANPSVGRLPGDSLVKAVAETHENGWITGSRGWGYKWSPIEAKRLVLRTHTTAETIKHLATHKKPPIKVFSVDRVYRNEQVTYKNIAEFHQIEGIVMGRNVTFRDLMGVLKTFYTKFGLEKVEFWPCYFPYTEPSAQVMVYHPRLKRWMELCGMGMFRPEVLAPMGIKHHVLAWGGGLERLAMVELGLDDIRMLYGNNLGWLRRTPLCR